MRLYANEYIFFQICFILLQQVRKSSSCSLFLFSAFFKGAPIVVYVSERMHEPHAFVMLSAPWWRPGNEEKRKDPPF